MTRIPLFICCLLVLSRQIVGRDLRFKGLNQHQQNPARRRLAMDDKNDKKKKKTDKPSVAPVVTPRPTLMKSEEKPSVAPFAGDGDFVSDTPSDAPSDLPTLIPVTALDDDAPVALPTATEILPTRTETPTSEDAPSPGDATDRSLSTIDLLPFSVTIVEGSTTADELEQELSLYLFASMSKVYSNCASVVLVGNAPTRRLLQTTTSYTYAGVVVFRGGKPPAGDVQGLQIALVSDTESLNAAVSGTVTNVAIADSVASRDAPSTRSNNESAYLGGLIGGVAAAASVMVLAVYFVKGGRCRKSRPVDEIEEAAEEEDLMHEDEKRGDE